MGKKVISFSLYGKQPKYTMGAVANARHASMAYPGWICRFYVADDVPKGIVSRLRAHGAEVVNMGQRFGHEAMFWRLYAAFEPENEIVIFRDTDSRFVKCELVMVNEWLASDKKFHVMRWDYSPDVSVMGGLWGLRGHISELRDPVKKCLDSKNFWLKGADERFLNKNLTPKMKGKVYVNEPYSLKLRRCFIGEPIHPFPSFAYTNSWPKRVDERFLNKNLPPKMKGKDYVNEPYSSKPRRSLIGDTIYPFPPFAYTKRGKYLETPSPIGMAIPSRRVFIVLSIYKNTPLYEYFLARLIGTIEKRNFFRQIETFHLANNYYKVRFYVADNIRPDLIERLRCLGQVILKPAKTTHKDDPKYWKLSILSESGLGMAMIVGFWKFFFLTRGTRYLGFSELLPIENSYKSTVIKGRIKGISPLSVCGPDSPVANIDSLIAQRNPKESYQKFMRSTVYPRIADVRMTVRLRREYYPVSFLNYWAQKLLPSNLHATLIRIRKHS